MINILVVDDEPIAADGISIYLEGHGDPDWVVTPAYSGENAILSARQRIDILLTDICMPDINGFDLQKRLLERWPLMKTVFLTGNGEVGLAQQAIRQGNTVDYVLKMEDETVILQAVRNAVEQLSEEEQKLDAVKKAEQELKAILPILQKDLLLSMIRGQVAQTDIAERFSRLHMSLFPDAEILLLAVHLNACAHPNELSQGILENVLERYLWPIYRFAVVMVTERRIAVMIQADKKTARIDAQHVYSLLEMAQQHFSKAVGGAVFVLNYDTCSWQDVSRHYRALALTIEKNLDEPDDSLIMQGKAETLPEFLSLRELRMIRTCLEQQDYDQAGAFCRSLPVPHTPAGKIDQYRYLLKLFSDAANVGPNADSLYLSLPIPVLKLGEEGWRQTVSDFSLLFRSMGGTRADSGNRREMLTETICRYVAEHLSEDLSLAQIAEVTHHSIPYLSKIFAETKGITYNAYVVDQRMEKARTCLKSNRDTLNEIIEKTGYRSTSYFIHAFREKYGITPSEYRKMSEKEP